MKTFLTANRVALAAALLAVSGGVQATIIDSATNNPLNFTWSYTTSSNTLLTGFGTMTVSGFNSSSLTISTSLTNTSSIGGQGGERLTSFGFGIDPNATGVSFSDTSDGGMVDATLYTGQGNDSIPSLHDVIEVCAYGGVNCAGGSNGGIEGAGGSDAFTVTLAGTWGSSVNIDPIGFKYQTGYGSFEFTSSSSSSSTSSTTSTTTSSGTTSTSSGTTSTSSGTVAEPGTSSMALLALGLLALGLRNSRAVKQS
jgi:hypothetical protein